MELASMLAGERFSDHPRAVCPVIAGFLRSYNDRLPPEELPQLYPLASLVVGSASTWGVRRRRARRLREWTRAGDPASSGSRGARVQTCADTVIAAAWAAVDMDPGQRRAAVSELVSELVAMGRHAPSTFDAAPVPGERPRRRAPAKR
jgi:hypothetical protein